MRNSFLWSLLMWQALLASLAGWKLAEGDTAFGVGFAVLALIKSVTIMYWVRR